MKKNILWSVFLFILTLPSKGWSCPFCDLGGRDTALFILSIFGFFALGALIIFIVFLKSGGLRERKDLETKVLKAEGIKEHDDKPKK